MNYFKKILSLGFKKIDTFVIYDMWTESPMQIDCETYLKDCNSKKFIHVIYPKMEKNELLNVKRNTKCFSLKLSNFYVILMIYQSSYSCFLKLNNIIDKKLNNSSIRAIDNTTMQHVISSKLSDSFWKEILNKLDIKAKREIILKNLI